MNAQNPFADFQKAFSDVKMPAFNYNQFFAIQRRNVEAFSTANQLLAEGVQAVSRRHAELARENVQEVLNNAKDMMTGGSPEANTAKQTELAKAIFQKSLSNMREASELFTKSSFEAFELLNKRASDSIEELQKAA